MEWYQDENGKWKDRRYPNYKSVIPYDQPYHIDLEEEKELAYVIKRIAGCANKHTNAIQINPDGWLYAVDLDFDAKAKIHFPFKGNWPEGFYFRVNAKFLADMLRLEGGCLIEFETKTRSFVFKRRFEEGDLIRFVMPVFVANGDIDFAF